MVAIHLTMIVLKINQIITTMIVDGAWRAACRAPPSHYTRAMHPRAASGGWLRFITLVRRLIAIQSRLGSADAHSNSLARCCCRRRRQRPTRTHTPVAGAPAGGVVVRHAQADAADVWA